MSIVFPDDFEIGDCATIGEECWTRYKYTDKKTGLSFTIDTRTSALSPLQEKIRSSGYNGDFTIPPNKTHKQFYDELEKEYEL